MKIALIIFAAGLYAAQGAWIPYIGLWLAEQGVAPAALAVLFSIMLLSKVASNPVVAHFCDMSGRPERVAVLVTLLLALCYGVLLVPVLPLPALVCLVILASALAPTLFPIIDRLILRASGETGQGFGRLRMWGSLGFAAGTLVGGQIAIRFGLTPVIALVTGLVVLSVSGLLLSQERFERHAGRWVAPVRAPLRALLSVPQIWPALLAASLIIASNAHLYTLAPLEWAAAGLSPATISLVLVSGVVAEVLGFWYASALAARVNPSALLAVAGCLSAARWGIMAVTAEPALLIAAQTGQAATIALTSMALATAVARHVPDNMRVTAFAMFTLLGMGPFISAATLLGGAAQSEFGLSGFAFMVPIAMLAAVLAATQRIFGTSKAREGARNAHE